MQRREFLQTTAAAACAGVLAVPEARGALEASRTIVDTHQHLWDLSQLKLPWLADAPEILRKTYHLAEYRAATQGMNMRAVYMEVDVDPSQLVAEAEHVLGICRAGTQPTCGAVIGGRPESPEFAAYLDRFKDHPALKGVRRVLHTPATPPGYCLGEQFVRNVRLLGERGLSYDLCLRPAELGDGVKLTELCPDTRFILDHCGNGDPLAFRPAAASGDKPWHTAEEWKAGIDRMAKRPNVICKISGVIARLPAGGDASALAPIVNYCLDAFGPERVVFGSDWPVCLLGGSLATWVKMLDQLLAARPALEQQKLWSQNALRLYRLS